MILLARVCNQRGAPPLATSTTSCYSSLACFPGRLNCTTAPRGGDKKTTSPLPLRIPIRHSQTTLSFRKLHPHLQPASGASLRGASSSTNTSGNLKWETVGELIPSRLCQDTDCGPPPGQLLLRNNKGFVFAGCSNNVKDDPNSCQFSATRLGKDRDPSNFRTSCLRCNLPVSFCVSLGKLTGATNPDGGLLVSGPVAPVSLPRETQNDTGRLHLRQLVLELDGSRPFPNLVAENWQLFGSFLALLEQPAKTTPLLFLS